MDAGCCIAELADLRVQHLGETGWLLRMEQMCGLQHWRSVPRALLLSWDGERK